MVAKRDMILVLFDARRVLRLTQGGLGEALGVSKRTVVRWEGGQSVPYGPSLATLASLLHPHDRGLAAEVAAHANTTLESLALQVPPPAAFPPAALHPAPSPAPGPVVSARTKASDLVDVLVLAAVTATGGSTPDVRRWLHEVLKRGCDVGLTMEEAEQALRPWAATSAPTSQSVR